MRLVVIASSAGGLAALSGVLSGLPRTFPAPLLVVQHIQAGHPSSLVAILSRRTELSVRQTAGSERPEAGVVYVAPPGHHVVVVDGPALALDDSPPLHFLRPCADLLFESAARVCGACVIGVVLTGNGSDGAAGIRAIKISGGVVIAQDRASAAFPSMPESAVATGSVDYVLPLAAIAGKLVALIGASNS
jgi:two-component system chemotaxis response regulator CheB